MPIPMDALDILDREFLEIRAKLLELAASFDRIDRADGTVSTDPRVAQLHEAARLLVEKNTGRAERLQLIFSRSYEESWQKDYGIAQ